MHHRLRTGPLAPGRTESGSRRPAAGSRSPARGARRSGGRAHRAHHPSGPPRSRGARDAAAPPAPRSHKASRTPSAARVAPGGGAPVSRPRPGAGSPGSDPRAARGARPLAPKRSAASRAASSTSVPESRPAPRRGDALNAPDRCPLTPCARADPSQPVCAPPAAERFGEAGRVCSPLPCRSGAARVLAPPRAPFPAATGQPAQSRRRGSAAACSPAQRLAEAAGRAPARSGASAGAWGRAGRRAGYRHRLELPEALAGRRAGLNPASMGWCPSCPKEPWAFMNKSASVAEVCSVLPFPFSTERSQFLCCFFT